MHWSLTISHQHTKEELANTLGKFVWNFRYSYFIETDIGNYIYDSEVNTITEYKGTLKQLFGGYWGKSKGIHKINDFCKPNWTLN